MSRRGKERFPFARSHIKARRVVEGCSWKVMVFSHISSACILSMTMHRGIALQVILKNDFGKFSFSDKVLNEMVLSLRY